MEKKKAVKKGIKPSVSTKGLAGERKKTGSAAAGRGVKFVFHGKEARQVYLTGEFNSWDTQSLPMVRSNGGEWQVEVDLAPGRYEYNFFVDGVWVQDPACREKVVNPYGSQNCVIQVS